MATLGRPTEPVPRAPRVKNKTGILFLTSAPADQEHLRTDLDLRAMSDVLRGSRFRQRFDLQIRSAAQIGDLFRELCDGNASILHFSGHGVPDGIAFENAS